MLAHGCGSTAWVSANLANHDFMLALWPREAQDEVWEADTARANRLGAHVPAGAATKVPGGYRLTGRWKFSSGIDACTWTMLGGIASADGELPDYRVFLLPASDYRIIDTWHAAGLRGTGSNDVEVKDVFVPEHRALAVELMKGCGAAGLGGESRRRFTACRCSTCSRMSSRRPRSASRRARSSSSPRSTRHRMTSYSTTLLADHATTQARLGEAAAASDAAELMLVSELRARDGRGRAKRACPPSRRRSGCGATAHMPRACVPARWTCCSKPAAANSCTTTSRCSARSATCTRRRATTRSRGTSRRRPQASPCSGIAPDLPTL